MKLKQTRKKIILSAFVVVFLGAVGFFANKLFINNNKTNAAGGSGIAIDYTVDNRAVRKLGDPASNNNPILENFQADYFEKLRSWSEIVDLSGAQVDEDLDHDETARDSEGRLPLTTLIADELVQSNWKNPKITFSDSNKWHEGKRIAGGGNARAMRSVKFLELPIDNDNNGIKGEDYWEDVYWTISTDDGYSVKVEIVESQNTGSTSQPLTISKTGNYIASGIVFSPNCNYARQNSNDNWWGYSSVSETSAKPENFAEDTRSTWPHGGVTGCNTAWVPDTEEDEMPSNSYRRTTNKDTGQDSIFIKLRYTITDAPDTFYMKIDDVDAAQSYSFQNLGVCDALDNPINTNHTGGSCNIYVNPADNEKFQYNAKTEYIVGNTANDEYINTAYEDNYIYYDDQTVSVFSTHTDANGANPRQIVDNPDAANIYIKFDKTNTTSSIPEGEMGATADRSVDFVYGFTGDALSRWEFLTQAFNVTWNAVDDTMGGVSIANVLNHNGTRVNESATDSIYEGETIGNNIPTIYNDDDGQSHIENPWAKYAIDHWTADKAITINGQTYSAGASIPTDKIKTLPIEDDYTFTAHLVTRSDYTITWKNDNGTTLETDTNVAYGSTPHYDGATPTKASTAQYSYVFAGWTPEIRSVDGNATYTATYTQTTRTYTITWKNYNGTTLETDTNVAYGSTPHYDGATPTRASTERYSYTFSGWTPTISAVTDDKTYTAKYTQSDRSDYTIIWTNYDDTVLETDTNVAYGSTPHYDGATPTRASTAEWNFTFDGWAPTISVVTGDKTYKATYTRAKRSDYTITWKNYDGTTLETDTNVAYGSAPQYNGTIPTKPADDTYTYTFIGWDPAISPVTGNATYTAQYKRDGIDYVVRFYNEDKTTLLAAGTYEYNEKITTAPTATKNPTEQYVYNFSGFLPMDTNTPELVVGTTPVTRDYNYYATFTPAIRKYEITFVDDDDKLIDEILLEYGQTPSHDKAPDKKVDNCAYTFSKWTPEFAVVTGPATYKATYTKECVEDVPNTGLGETLGGANGNNTTIIIAIAGIFAATSAATAYRFYRRRRIMKF